ncbi:MAG: hypothetical protein GQE15_10475, partial [Archangiaceae bacterium]|nr:hypothetical protein [Archangiaceae bacterium]
MEAGLGSTPVSVADRLAVLLEARLPVVTQEGLRVGAAPVVRPVAMLVAPSVVAPSVVAPSVVAPSVVAPSVVAP